MNLLNICSLFVNDKIFSNLYEVYELKILSYLQYFMLYEQKE
jgi:hypothetical protein